MYLCIYVYIHIHVHMHMYIYIVCVYLFSFYMYTYIYIYISYIYIFSAETHYVRVCFADSSGMCFPPLMITCVLKLYLVRMHSFVCVSFVAGTILFYGVFLVITNVWYSVGSSHYLLFVLNVVYQGCIVCLT